MRCRNCTHFSELAAKGTGCCDKPDAEYPALIKVNAADPGCPEFEPRRPARRRRTAPAAASPDAQAIASAIAAGFERIASVLEYSLPAMREDDDNVFKAASRGADRLHDMNEHLERLVEHLIDD